jgi:stearoyl-CoA desaturase (Delta-9 desaturase)
MHKGRLRWARMPAVTFVGLVSPWFALVFGWWWHGAQGVPVRAMDIALLLVFYSTGLIGVEIGYHRCFAHRAFEATPWGARLLAIMGATAFQGAPLWWVATHRQHHARCDRQGDPHSPNLHDGTWRARVRALLWAHGLWLLFQPETPNGKSRVPPVFDLLKRRELWLIDRAYGPIALSSLLLPGLVSWLACPGLESAVSGVLWGGFLRVLLSTNAFMALNSLGHLVGTRPNATPDRSRNNGVLALLTFGQGWHNNHHARPRAACLAFKPWQLDPGYAVIKLLLWTGLGRRTQPEHVSGGALTDAASHD